jgi:hypothetical protein
LFGNSEVKVADDLKLIPDVEREGNGYVAAGGNVSRLLMSTSGGRVTCDEPVLEETQPRRPSEKKRLDE